jgi:hypothetical protein
MDCINHETSYKSSMSKQRRFISGHLSIIIFHLYKCVFTGLFEVFRFIEYEKKVAMIKALEFLTMKCSF